MGSYVPPFTVSAKAISMVAEISALIERYSIRLEQADGLLLRKANRIKTIHSSLAIEGNELSESQVSDVLEGKPVLAPLAQLQEVRNAIRTYEEYPTLNPFNLDDMLRAHGLMMAGLRDDAGQFRRGGVGVFAGEKCIHMAPPAHMVPSLMADLFDWLNRAEDHLLIRSCVFHYEFEFIHPFSDGNGRSGRLWQSLILGRLHPAFAYLPVENMVYSNQAEYYRAIEQSSKKADCAPFIEFMLGEILSTLKKHRDKSSDVGINVGINVGISSDNPEEMVLQVIRQDAYASARQIAEMVGLTSRQVERIIARLKTRGILVRCGARKNGRWQIVGE
jgi:Fic family protein